MVMVVVEKVSSSLRGELSRCLMEISAGVFLGQISALVRELLWKKICGKIGKGGGIMIYPWTNEQGFLLKKVGKTSRELIDFDGMVLVRKPHSVKRLKIHKITK